MQHARDARPRSTAAHRDLCRSYGYAPLNRSSQVERRIFYGSLISYESTTVFHLLAAEVTRVVDHITFVESNLTHRGTAIPWHYTEESYAGVGRRLAMTNLFPGVEIAFERHIEWPRLERLNGMGRDLGARDAIPKFWKVHGMAPKDVGIMADTDEMFSRSYMRALKVCDVPQLRTRMRAGAADINCMGAKIPAAGMVFEGALDCMWRGRRWFHPDAMLGECIEGIGLRPPGTSSSYHRYDKFGRGLFFGEHYGGADWKAFQARPGLWSGADLKLRENHPSVGHKRPNAFHFHNFFTSAETLQRKYFSYAHYDPNGRAKSVADYKLEDTDGNGRMHVDIAVLLNCQAGNKDPRRHEALYATGWGPDYVDAPHWVKKLARNFTKRAGPLSMAVKLAKSWSGMLVSNPRTRVEAGLKPLEPVATVSNPPPPPQRRQSASVTDASSRPPSPAPVPVPSNNSAPIELLIRSDLEGSPLDPTAVITVITNRQDTHPFKVYVGGLRATGYNGHIILGISANPPFRLIKYLRQRRTTVYGLRELPCSKDVPEPPRQGQTLRQRRTCEGIDTMPIEWGRFALAARWLRENERITSWVLLTDGTDVFFQRPPFISLPAPGQATPHELYVVPEPYHTVEHWFTSWPMKQCYGYAVGGDVVNSQHPMLNVGSIYGTRAGMLGYLDTLLAEFATNLRSGPTCRPPIMNDQTVLNTLYYSGRLGQTVPSVTEQGAWNGGVVQTVGSACSRVVNGTFREGMKEFVATDSAGYVLNADGQRAPVVHQYDRCHKWISDWVYRTFAEV